MPKYQNSLFAFKRKIEEMVDFDKISEKISEPRIPIEIYILHQNLSPDDFRKKLIPNLTASRWAIPDFHTLEKQE
jgi:hypothetical protein